jgi:16S rRNA (guanine(1405)-N(7))-methyltransferase
MSNSSKSDIDALVEAICASKKYAAISKDLVRAIGLRELAARRKLKEAIKATKNKLHQVAGAFLDARPPYDAWLEQLANVQTACPEALLSAVEGPAEGFQRSNVQTVCRNIMAHHASTRERLPVLDSFYRQIFGVLPPIHSVLDVACGLNPLAIPWMPLAPGATYAACDLYADMIEFLNGFFQIAGIAGHAQVCDLVSGPPRQSADLALVLKTLPTLEQIAKDAGRDLLRALDAPYLLVSFPARSLGGRDKRMAAHYAQRFEAVVAAEGWPAERFEFASELAFLVRK